MKTLLVSKSEEIVRLVKEACLRISGTVETTTSDISALRYLALENYNAIYFDLALERIPVSALVKKVLDMQPRLPFIALIRPEHSSQLVRLYEAGAFDFMILPLDEHELDQSFRQCIQFQAVQESLPRSIKEKLIPQGLPPMYGNSNKIQEVLLMFGKTLENQVPVALFGKSGTGKEGLAQLIHNNHPVAQKGAFVPINCAAIPEQLLESELFGHEKGAFTGAIGSRRGKFEQARGGTLFLDEIGEMSVHLQSKILRSLEGGVIQRVGGEKEIPVSFRFITATNKDLETEVQSGRFREDLFFRINVFPIPLPPLAERRNDVSLIACHYLALINQRDMKKITGFTPEALGLLRNYQWPGNVRELKNVVERAALLTDDSVISYEDLPVALSNMLPESARPADDENLKVSSDFGDEERAIVPLQEVELRAIKRAVEICGGNISKAADSLGISRATLYRKLSLEIEENG